MFFLIKSRQLSGCRFDGKVASSLLVQGTLKRHSRTSLQCYQLPKNSCRTFFYPLLPYRFFCYTAYFLKDCKLIFKLQKGGRGRAQGKKQESFGKFNVSLWVINWEKFSSLRITSNTKQISLKLIAQSTLKYCVGTSSWVLDVVQKPSS